MLIPLHYMKLKYRMNITGIMHVGAHLAEELADYTEQGIHNVVWVEADKDTFKKLCEVIPPHQFAFQAAVSDKVGEVLTFHRANNGQSSSLLELGTHEQEHPEVTFIEEIQVVTSTIDQLSRCMYASVLPSFDAAPKSPVAAINMLNLDIQGAELKALEGAKDSLYKVDYIYTEVNEKELYKGCALLPDLDAFLSEHDFKRVETAMTPHGWGDALYVKS